MRHSSYVVWLAFEVVFVYLFFPETAHKTLEELAFRKSLVISRNSRLITLFFLLVYEEDELERQRERFKAEIKKKEESQPQPQQENIEMTSVGKRSVEKVDPVKAGTSS